MVDITSTRTYPALFLYPQRGGQAELDWVLSGYPLVTDWCLCWSGLV